MSTDNIHHIPGDLSLLGFAAMTGAAITMKAYHNDAHTAYAATHSECSFLVTNEDKKITVLKNNDLTKPEFTPSLCHSVNCVVRADFFQSKEFREKFNYMQK